MLYDFSYFVHNSLGLHFWDLPTILIGVVMIIMLIVHTNNQKKREKKFDQARKKKLEAMQQELNEPKVMILDEDSANA